MSEGIRFPQGRARLTVGHSFDVTAGLTPLGLAVIAFAGAWYFDWLSTPGLFLRLCGAALAGMGIAILFFRIAVPNPREYYGGLALMGLALVAFWAGADLPGLRGFSFGPGTAPRLFAALLTGIGLMIAVLGLLSEGYEIGGYAVRGPVLVTASILSFAMLIRPAGLIIASFLTFMISAMASKETRWIESLIMAVALTIFCVVLFVYLLNLPFQLWPRYFL